MTVTMHTTRYDRKAELTRQGIANRRIAKALAVDESLVSHVIAGRRLTGEDARRVMDFIAEKLGTPVEMAFPELSLADDQAGQEVVVDASGDSCRNDQQARR
jgi:hypothetical protein